jgi:hypothetical protein
MNLAAQNILFPLCCTLFTKPNTPLGRREGEKEAYNEHSVLRGPGDSQGILGKGTGEIPPNLFFDLIEGMQLPPTTLFF